MQVGVFLKERIQIFNKHFIFVKLKIRRGFSPYKTSYGGLINTIRTEPFFGYGIKL